MGHDVGLADVLLAVTLYMVTGLGTATAPATLPRQAITPVPAPGSNGPCRNRMR
jgi:hypothetical protein